MDTSDVGGGGKQAATKDQTLDETTDLQLADVSEVPLEQSNLEMGEDDFGNVSGVPPEFRMDGDLSMIEGGVAADADEANRTNDADAFAMDQTIGNDATILDEQPEDVSLAKGEGEDAEQVRRAQDVAPTAATVAHPGVEDERPEAASGPEAPSTLHELSGPELATINVKELKCLTKTAKLIKEQRCASQAVQFLPDGGTFDFARPSARTPHGGASCVQTSWRTREKHPPEKLRRPSTRAG